METGLVETGLMETGLVETELVETALVETLLKYQFWKNVTSEKWNSEQLTTFQHICPHLIAIF